jgi:hypothetical protein
MPKSLLTPSVELTNSTKEYYHHRVHACLGIYVLVHFIYRYVLFFSSTSYEYDGDDDNNIEIAINNANENENENDLGFNLLLINNNNNASDDPGGDDTTMNTTTYLYCYYFYYVYFIILFLPHFFLRVSGFGFSIPKIHHPDGN